MSEDEAFPLPIKPSEVAPHLSAWVSPEGKIYNVDGCKHFYVASLMNTEPSRLENKGWAHFSFGRVINRVKYTQRQIDAFVRALLQALNELPITGGQLVR